MSYRDVSMTGETTARQQLYQAQNGDSRDADGHLVQFGQLMLHPSQSPLVAFRPTAPLARPESATTSVDTADDAAAVNAAAPAVQTASTGRRSAVLAAATGDQAADTELAVRRLTGTELRHLHRLELAKIQQRGSNQAPKRVVGAVEEEGAEGEHFVCPGDEPALDKTSVEVESHRLFKLPGCRRRRLLRFGFLVSQRRHLRWELLEEQRRQQHQQQQRQRQATGHQSSAVTTAASLLRHCATAAELPKTAVGMPPLSGFKGLLWRKSASSSPHLPVLLLSSEERRESNSWRNPGSAFGNHSRPSVTLEDSHLLMCLARVDGSPLEQLPPVFVELDILASRSRLEAGDKIESSPSADRSQVPRSRSSAADSVSTDRDWSWLETARWVRYEQDYDAVTGSFDKAHSSPLTLQAVVECRRYLEQGAIVLRTSRTPEADHHLPPITACQCQDSDACRQVQLLLAQVRLATGQLLLLPDNNCGGGGVGQRDIDLLRQVIGLRHRHVCDGRRPGGGGGGGAGFPTSLAHCIAQRIRLRNQDLEAAGGTRSRLRQVNTSVDLHHGMVDHRDQQRTNSVPVSLDKQTEVQSGPRRAVESILSSSASRDRVEVAKVGHEATAFRQVVSQLTAQLSSSASASSSSACQDVELGGKPGAQEASGFSSAGVPSSSSSHQLSDLTGRLSAATEIVSVQVGVLPGLQKPLLVFLRLGRPLYAPGLTELHGSHPVRFLIVFLGPRRSHLDYCEVGRVFATMMVDKTFRQVAYTAVCREDLLLGLRSFLDATIVLPMVNDITPTSLLAMHAQLRAFRRPGDTSTGDEEEASPDQPQQPVRTGSSCSHCHSRRRAGQSFAGGGQLFAGGGGQSPRRPSETVGVSFLVGGQVEGSAANTTTTVTTSNERLVSLAAATRFKRRLLLDRSQSSLLAEAEEDENGELAASSSIRLLDGGRAKGSKEKPSDDYLLPDGLDSESDYESVGDGDINNGDGSSCGGSGDPVLRPGDTRSSSASHLCCCCCLPRRCAPTRVSPTWWCPGLALMTDLVAYRHRFSSDFVCLRRRARGSGLWESPGSVSSSSSRGETKGSTRTTAGAAATSSDLSLIFSTVVFLYFVVLAPAVTFGALLNNLVSTSFSIPLCVFASGLTQCLFAVIGGQPLLIVGITGPMLILETCIKLVCEVNLLALGPMRLLIAGYTALLGLVCVLANAGWLVLSVRRSLEEVFNFFVSFYFIFKALKSLLTALFEVESKASSRLPVDTVKNTTAAAGGDSLITTSVNRSTIGDLVDQMGSHMQGNETVLTSGDPAGVEQARALANLLLALVMFTVCIWLQAIKRGRYFRRSMRNGFGYFNVPIGLLVTVGINRLLFPGLNVPTVEMPSHTVGVFPPLASLVAPPFATAGHGVAGNQSPFATDGQAVVGGWPLVSGRSHGLALLLAVCLLPAIATDTVLSGITVAKSERRLRKPSLFSLDLVVSTCIMPLVSGLLGWPFLSPAAVRSNTHVTALTKWNTRTPPGVPHRIIGCVEQRITGFAIGLFLTLSVAVESRIFGLVPMGALYGMFLYMGVMGLRDLTLIRRLSALLKRHKHWKDREYLHCLPPRPLGLFVTVQLAFISLLLSMNWITEFARVGQTSLVFPFILLAFALVREFGLTRLRLLAPHLDQMDCLHSLHLPEVRADICHCYSRSYSSPRSRSTDVDVGDHERFDVNKDDAASSTGRRCLDGVERRCPGFCPRLPSHKKFSLLAVTASSPSNGPTKNDQQLAGRRIAGLRNLWSVDLTNSDKDTGNMSTRVK